MTLKEISPALYIEMRCLYVESGLDPVGRPITKGREAEGLKVCGRKEEQTRKAGETLSSSFSTERSRSRLQADLDSSDKVASEVDGSLLG